MKVSWDDYSQLNGKMKFMFQTNNQYIYMTMMYSFLLHAAHIFGDADPHLSGFAAALEVFHGGSDAFDGRQHFTRHLPFRPRRCSSLSKGRACEYLKRKYKLEHITV